MQSKPDLIEARQFRSRSRLGALTLILALALSLAGCISTLSKHSTALSAATTPVVDQAAAAYRAAMTLHEEQLKYDAFAHFDDKETVYNPRKIQPCYPKRTCKSA